MQSLMIVQANAVMSTATKRRGPSTHICVQQHHAASKRYASWQGCLCKTVLLGLYIMALLLVLPTAGGQDADEDRPAMSFCGTSNSDFIEFAQAGLEGWRMMNKGNDENSIKISDLSVSLPIMKVREIELGNTQNIYIGSGSSLQCDDQQMHVNMTFGIRDPAIYLRERAGSERALFIKMSRFEAYVLVSLPRKSQRIIVEKLGITNMDNLKVESRSSTLISSDVINTFLKSMPKGLLMSIVAKYMKVAVQTFLDKNPMGI